MKNFFLFISGALILILNKVRHSISGYQTPRAFSETEVDKVINYDVEVVETWLKYLSAYSNKTVDVANKNILEIGPGSDIGNGFILLNKGCKKYYAIDINHLLNKQDDEFYEKLISQIAEQDSFQIRCLKEEYERFKRNNGELRINYFYDKTFSFHHFKDKNIDIIFSQATFEHFTDVEKTITDFSAISRPGTVLISLVDLLTHTRVLRDRDPNNIYRFGKTFYNFFRFKGSPNRVRPYEYKQYLIDNGWENIEIIPHLEIVSGKEVFNNQFRDERNQMQYGLIFICATKG